MAQLLLAMPSGTPRGRRSLWVLRHALKWSCVLIAPSILIKGQTEKQKKEKKSNEKIDIVCRLHQIPVVKRVFAKWSTEKNRKYCIYGSWCNLNLASAVNSIMLQFQRLPLHLMNDCLVLHDCSTSYKRWYGVLSLIYHIKCKHCSKCMVIIFLTIFHLVSILHSVNGTHGTHHYNI